MKTKLVNKYEHITEPPVGYNTFIGYSTHSTCYYNSRPKCVDTYLVDDLYVRFYGDGYERFKLPIKDCTKLVIELLA